MKTPAPPIRPLSDLRELTPPRIGLTDAMRNCVSNIHGAGLSYDEAAFKIAWLVREGLARQVTGVALKDESGGGSTAQIASDKRECDKSET